MPDYTARALETMPSLPPFVTREQYWSGCRLFSPLGHPIGSIACGNWRRALFSPQIETDKNLPDLILADLGPSEPLIVFVEIVATDGAITPRRQEAIYAITDAAGFHRSHIAFVTAYLDRDSAGFRKTIAALAWNSFVWFASEPENIVILRDGVISPARLSQLVGG